MSKALRGHPGVEAPNPSASHTNGRQGSDEAHGNFAATRVRGVDQNEIQARVVDPSDALLLILSDALDDLERTRIALENRHRSLTTVKGMLGADQAAMSLQETIELLQAREDVQIKELERAMAAHRFGPWVKRTKGVGLKQAARMIATIGDPLYNDASERPRRGPGELCQFCGHGDPKRSRRRKGQRIEFNPSAKTRVWLVAASCIKQRGTPFRAVYDQKRAHYAEAVHDEPCVRCGPAGHPAPAGSPLSDGHKHGRALRAVGKAVLKSLFNEAKALDHESDDAQEERVERTS